jgi:hypothetical protein
MTVISEVDAIAISMIKLAEQETAQALAGGGDDVEAGMEDLE